jgi:acyl carrier protein
VPEAPLFGKGLYLDFIDALKSVLAISKIHGLQLRSEDKANPRIFASLHALSAHIVR